MESNFAPFQKVYTVSGTRLTSCSVAILGCILPVVKQPKRDAEQPLPSSDEVKKEWNYNSDPKCAFIAGTGTFVSLE
jgi:hypothetical protein